MKSHVRFQFRAALIVAVFGCLISIGGCATWIGMANNSMPNVITGDNAFRVRFERPAGEALDDFQGFLESRNIKILSVNSDTIRTEPSNMYGGQVQGYGQEIRFIATAEGTGNGSQLTVKAEYLDPGSGEWREANSKGNVLLGQEMQGTRPHFRAYRDVLHLLVTRYGSKNVKFVRTDLQY